MVTAQELVGFVMNRKYVVPVVAGAYGVACVIALFEAKGDVSTLGVQSRVCMALALVMALFAVAVRIYGVHHLGSAQQMVQTYADADARAKLAGGGPQLITTGPYAYTRNPLYLGIYLLNISFGLALRVWSLAFLVLFFTVRWTIVVRDEEKDVRATFGAPHEAYAQQVNAFLPFPQQFVGLARNMAHAPVPWASKAVSRDLRWALWYVVAYTVALVLAVTSGGSGAGVLPLLVVVCGSGLALTFLWRDVFAVYFVKPKAATN